MIPTLHPERTYGLRMYDVYCVHRFVGIKIVKGPWGAWVLVRSDEPTEMWWNAPRRTDDLFRIEGDPVLRRIPFDNPKLDTIPIPYVRCQFGAPKSCYATAVDLLRGDDGNWKPMCQDHLST